VSCAFCPHEGEVPCPVHTDGKPRCAACGKLCPDSRVYCSRACVVRAADRRRRSYPIENQLYVLAMRVRLGRSPKKKPRLYGGSRTELQTPLGAEGRLAVHYEETLLEGASLRLQIDTLRDLIDRAASQLVELDDRLRAYEKDERRVRDDAAQAARGLRG
jgi:hypothetical protein